eukprot:297980-Pyramimonas_sp.AAC.1
MDTGPERHCDRHFFKWHRALRHIVRQRSAACSCTTTASTCRATQPASFAPMNRATTPFGTPQSAGSNNSLQARLQRIRMDPQLH